MLFTDQPPLDYLTFLYEKQYKHVRDVINPAPIPKSEEKMNKWHRRYCDREEKSVKNDH